MNRMLLLSGTAVAALLWLSGCSDPTGGAEASWLRADIRVLDAAADQTGLTHDADGTWAIERDRDTGNPVGFGISSLQQGAEVRQHIAFLGMIPGGVPKTGVTYSVSFDPEDRAFRMFLSRMAAGESAEETVADYRGTEGTVTLTRVTDRIVEGVFQVTALEIQREPITGDPLPPEPGAAQLAVSGSFRLVPFDDTVRPL